MAINKVRAGEIIDRQNLVDEINDKCYKAIKNLLGTIHTSDGNSGNTGLTTAGVPTFSGTSYYGFNTPNGTVQYTNPPAVPDGQLTTFLDPNVFPNYGKNAQVSPCDINDTYVTASTIYNSLIKMLKLLTHIRRFKSTWIHEGGQRGGNYSAWGTNCGFTTGTSGYGLFRDTPATVNEGQQLSPGASSPPGVWNTALYGYGWGWGFGLYKWKNNSGVPNWSSLQIHNTCLQPMIVSGNEVNASVLQGIFNQFVELWKSKCLNDTYDMQYIFYTCHLNCWQV